MRNQLARGMVACVLVVAGCGTSSGDDTAAPSSTQAPVTTASSAPTATTSSTQPAATGGPGIPEYTAPAPDPQGVVACDPTDGWGMGSSGAGISVFATTDEPASVTAVVRRRSGDDSSQSAMTGGEGPTFLHQFDFPTVDPSSVLEVVLTKPTGRCYAEPDPEVSAAYPDTQGAR